MAEHCSATLACLLSGVKVFLHECDQQDRVYRMFKGHHGLHVYASEYWTDYLLSVAEAENGSSTSQILTLACKLAQRLDQTAVNTTSRTHSSTDGEVDARLQHLLGYPSLGNHVRNFLRAKSLQTLESRLQQTAGKSNIRILICLFLGGSE